MKNSIEKNSLFNIIYNVSNIIFPLIISMYVSRILGPEGMGQVSYAQNIASYFVTFSALGIPTHGVREIAKTKNNQSDKNKIFTELFFINATTTVCATTVYLILIIVISSFRNDILLFLCYGLQVFMNLFNMDWLYQGSENYVYIAKRSILIKLVSLIAVFLFVKSRNDYIIYALISVLSITANHIFNIIHSRVYVKFDFADLHISRHIKPLIILGISIFMSSLYSKVDVTMLGGMSNQTVVGLYSNSHKIIEIIITLCTSISAVFLPRLSFYYKKDRVKFYGLIDYGIEILSFITIPMMIGLFILAPEAILIMYGDSFAPAVVTIRIFTPLIVLKSFGNLLCYQLVIATGNEKKRLPAYFIAATTNITFNALLIPILSQNGSVIASVLSEFLVNSMQFVAMKKILCLRISIKPIIQAVVGSLVMAATIILLKIFIHGMVIKAIACVVLGSLAYFIVNILLRNSITLKLIDRLRGED